MTVKINKAKSRMVTDHPFYACLLYRLKMVASEDFDTMATDGKSIFYNPAWVDTLPVAQITGVIAHECSHVGHGHHLRKGGRDHELWNIACDYAINDTLIKAGFKLPEGGLFDAKYSGWAAEKIYVALEKEQRKKQQQQNDGEQGDDKDGDSQGQSTGNAPAKTPEKASGCSWGEILDAVDEAGDALDEAGKAAEQRAISATLNEAELVERKAGNTSGGHARAMIETTKGDIQPWNEILCDALVDTIVVDQTFARPNRRLHHKGIRMPTDVTRPTGELVIVVDTSCSLDDHELSIIGHHVDDIVDAIDPTGVIVIYCDHTLNGEPIHFDAGEEVKLSIHGGGGTAFNPPFNWCARNDIEPQALLYFTDGEADVGPDAWFGRDFEMPDYPVFWITNHTDPEFSGCEEFGEIVYI